jgi:hypothetical protein
MIKARKAMAPCQQCGRDFRFMMTTKKRSVCNDCKKETAQEAAKRRLDEGHVAKPKEPKQIRDGISPCQQCGNDFKYKMTFKKRNVCDECKRLTARASEKRRRVESQEKPTESKPVRLIRYAGYDGQ